MRAAEFATLVRQVRQRADHYVAQCPAHEDQTPSLGFRDGQRALLVRCWAGCSVAEIARAVGARVEDLFHRPTERHQNRVRRRSLRPASPSHHWCRVWTDVLRGAEATGRHWAVWGPIFARADFVRLATRLAHLHRRRATTLGPDDPVMWDEAELAMRFDDEARLVETEAGALVVAARQAGR